MYMTILTILSLTVSGGIYLYLSTRIHAKSHSLGDHLPLMSDDSQARVESAQEFNAATVATTLSLATVILAYVELSPILGVWLLWTAITTAVGIVVVRVVSHRIWAKLSVFKNHRPTLHEFLGAAFDSNSLAKGAALCTSLGFLGALAVELTVGAHFLTGLVPSIPAWLAVLLLAGIGVTYTVMGGFRAVIITDRIQMGAIWAAIAALTIAVMWQISEQGGTAKFVQHLPRAVYDFSWREGLTSFLIGIFLINVPSFVSDMSIWQRVTASRKEEVITQGLAKSAIGAALSWSSLALLACALIGLTTPKEGENMLTLFLANIVGTGSLGAGVIFLVIVTGLFAASLSTASTQLIAAGHTLHTDLLRHRHDKQHLADSRSELTTSRVLLFAISSVAVLVVEILRQVGFSIADLVFAVYGAQLALVPAVIAALYADQKFLKSLGVWASVGVMLGFAAGWGCAAAGKLLDNGDLVFLSPLASLGISTIILGLGFIRARSIGHR